MGADVYLGGPIDGTDGAEQDWRRKARVLLDQAGISYYDPLTANAGETNPGRIVHRNMSALERCRVAFFCFPTPGRFGFGSPIEIWQACHSNSGIWTIVFTPSRLPHLYLRYLEQRGPLEIVHQWMDAIDRIALRLA